MTLFMGVAAALSSAGSLVTRQRCAGNTPCEQAARLLWLCWSRTFGTASACTGTAQVRVSHWHECESRLRVGCTAAVVVQERDVVTLPLRSRRHGSRTCKLRILRRFDFDAALLRSAAVPLLDNATALHHCITACCTAQLCTTALASMPAESAAVCFSQRGKTD